jgi:hypothetical protein
MSKAPENRDALYGMQVPRGSYALSGRQLGESLPDNAGKKPTDGPPMIINDLPPGCFPDDWQVTYGASRDAYLSIINGTFVQRSIDEISVDGIYKDGMVNADNDNLWKMATPPEGSVQQVQYIVSKATIEEATEDVADSYGELSEARGIGLRIPTIAAGYGRTIDGRPTDPNPSEDPFLRKNDEAHKLARETWKYGPVEYRWDYRRGVWSAYNELIVDHEEQDLGTWVFSTNPDSEKGFPFLRGRLEDVFWVRQPFELDGTDGTEEGVKTGEVMTHLEHRWYDDNEKACASLSSIFIIPHEESAHEAGDPDGCHFKADDEQTLGDETTANAERIDIKSDVHFFKERGVDGPVKFGRKVSELEDLLCCHNPTAKFMFGEMIFLDEALPVCEGQSASSAGASAASGDAETCKWIPAIQIDECELMGPHMVKLVTNDVNLAVKINEVCNEFTAYTDDMATSIDGNIQTVSDAIECINTEVQTLAASVSATISTVASEIADTANREFVAISDAFEELVASIIAALEACGCTEVLLTNPYPGPVDGFGHGISTPTIEAGDCPLGSITSTPTRDCESLCGGVQLQGPCTTQESFVVGEACIGGDVPDIDTEFGNCASHEDIA